MFKWPTAVLHNCSWNKADPAKALPSRGNGRMGVVDGARIGMRTTMLKTSDAEIRDAKGENMMFPKSHGMKLFNPVGRRPTATPAARPMIDSLVRRGSPRSDRIRCNLLSQADAFVRGGRAGGHGRA